MNNPLSIQQMTEMMNHAPIAVFVASVENRELYYANSLAKDLLLQDTFGETACCYHVSGYSQPCAFCHAEEMSRTKLFVREFRRPSDGRIYQLSGKLIDWDGRPAHVEYILDITERKKEEEKNGKLKEELQATFSNVPCGLCVYQAAEGGIFPLFHNPAFYGLMGYSQEHIQSIEEKTEYMGVHPEDHAALQEKIERAIEAGGVIQHTYRVWNDRKEEYRWIHLDASVKEQTEGVKLLYCVYSDVSERQRMEHELTLANGIMKNVLGAIPGGIASYRVEGDRLIPAFCSDGVMGLSGHTREEYREMVRDNPFAVIYEPDRKRVSAAAKAVLKNGELLDISYRMYHKNGSLIWIHLSGRRVRLGPESSEFYAVFTGMSAEAQLFRYIANETADGVYVIDKDSQELLYANESKPLFKEGTYKTGHKCYTALHGRKEPCEYCTLKDHPADGQEHEFAVAGTDRFYTARFSETDWNGIPAYVQYVRDITDEVKTRREKERLNQYFQTLVQNLPGGVAVIHYAEDGHMTPEYISDGFLSMTGMTHEKAWEKYRGDALAGIHPDDREYIIQSMAEYVDSGVNHYELTYRLTKGEESYIWVRAGFSILQSEEGDSRIYVVYRDITKEREEQEQLLKQYNDLIVRHYRSPGPNVLIAGHCNITQNRILEIDDHTDSALLERFGPMREAFFTGISGLITDIEERRAFLEIFLNAPAMEAFARGETEQSLNCFIKLPRDAHGLYVQFKMDLMEAPDSGDVTGILTVKDVTEQTLSERILHQISVENYDYVIDVDLKKDSYTVLACNQSTCYSPQDRGSFSGRTADIARTAILPKDRETYENAMEPEEIRRRLKRDVSYTVSYSLTDEKGEIRTKNMTISAVDLRINRVCLVRSDITDSVQALENALTMAEEGSLAKSNFLSAMSHDVRTPLNAIVGMTTIGLAHPGDLNRVKDCFNKISVASKHLQSLINDVLDMSRIEQSDMAMNRMDTSLSDLLRQAAEIIAPQAKSAGLLFDVQEAVSHAHFYGDSLRVNQILINLLSNAIKFTAEGGHVTLRAEELPSAWDVGNIRYLFTVSDTGSGMPEEFLSRIFEPFARSRRTARVEGNGLGLSIVKKLVDLMEGVISVESQVDKGTTFRVELEFEAAHDENSVQTEENWAQSVEDSREQAFSNRLFLVVEDNDVNAEILSELLRMQGAESVVCKDGLQAVAAFEEAAPGTYDAVLMDIQMPVMDGHEATRRIRALKRPDARTIPILAMTANAFTEDVQKSKAAGMTAHVAKPIDIDVLRSALAKALKDRSGRHWI